ncbi:hypothetical protein LOAG_12537, partial [Loa loa]
MEKYEIRNIRDMPGGKLFDRPINTLSPLEITEGNSKTSSTTKNLNNQKSQSPHESKNSQKDEFI